MIRIVVENVLLFLLPTLLYVIYVAATRKDNNRGILDEAPLAWLLFAGTALMLAVLAFYGSNTNGKPTEHYVPPTMQDGKIAPGHFD
ncbi:MAG: DUF6111 family protein [Hyphomicrobiaceae bacterium]